VPARVGTTTSLGATQALEEEGRGRVLVVDTGASMRCAVLGDNLAAMGVKNGWSVRAPPLKGGALLRGRALPPSHLSMVHKHTASTAAWLHSTKVEACFVLPAWLPVGMSCAQMH